MKQLFLLFTFLYLFHISIMATPLTDAIETNEMVNFEKLLNEGVNVNERNSSGYTPLMIASGFGNSRMVELLLNAGADVFILDSQMGASALHKAAQSGNIQVAQLLIEHGAFIDLQCPIQGNTPLIDAVWHKKPSMVKYLLTRGANMYVKNHGGAIAMDFAKRDNLLDIIKILQDEEDAISKKIESQKLIKATIANDIKEVKRLIKEGNDLDEKYPFICSQYDGYTPLLIASRNGNTEIVKLLLEAGANISLTCGLMKATPGHKAGYMGHPEIAKMLVAYGLDLNAQGPYNGYTALHDAIWHGHTDTARIYIEGGAKLDLRGHDGKTPLEFAEELGYIDIVNIIKKKIEESK